MKKRRSPATPATTAVRTAATAIKVQEAMGAAAAVIAARTEMALLGCAQPSAKTATEMALMVTEKLDAFSKSGAAMGVGAADLANRSARYAGAEVDAAAKGMQELAACRTPSDLVRVQTALLQGWLNRSYSFGLGVNASAAKAGEKALAPVHSAVTSNSRRLRRP